MTRAAGSGATRGAISSMIAQMEVCPACGKFLTEHRRSYRFGNPGACPDLVLGAFPMLPEEFAGLPVSEEPLVYGATSASNPPPAENSIGTFAAPFKGTRATGRRTDLLSATINLPLGSEDFP
ncbi:MAG: hypothetical protein L3K11_08150 [Thermoplasmata archaeon]|nr:hypothetical protein [Thermoplasmata archaeon]